MLPGISFGAFVGNYNSEVFIKEKPVKSELNEPVVVEELEVTTSEEFLGGLIITQEKIELLNEQIRLLKQSVFLLTSMLNK